MNVGFYVDSVGATPENGEIFDALNQEMYQLIRNFCL